MHSDILTWATTTQPSAKSADANDESTTDENGNDRSEDNHTNYSITSVVTLSSQSEKNEQKSGCQESHAGKDLAFNDFKLNLDLDASYLILDNLLVD